MNVLVDDVGSFPLPAYVKKQTFDGAYVLARKAMIDGKEITKNEFLKKNFRRVVIDSFRKKLETGLDIVNYPQHYDMYNQFIEAIHEAMNEGTYVVAEKEAVIPEVCLIKQEAKNLCEKFGKRIALRVCVTGPMELYLKEIGTIAYKDVLLMFAETVRRFASNATLNSKWVKTEVVSVDEPSFGYQDVAIDRDTVLDVLDRAFDFPHATRQIHLHSVSRIANVLDTRNIDVISLEHAASPKNLERISKEMLDKADKQVRIGITRTDIDSILAELHDKGVARPTTEHMVESEATIRKRFEIAKEKFGDRMTFTGPDCGLGGWPTPETAQALLKRTVNAVKGTHTNG
jgi:5-methyltetrahydropteroyltriglutamate--homocysteine methyltransferase